ncbi:MAG: hypothetical protein EOO20_23705 [Chryseobacterium sp.]|nr:MAG: hypothetical protein EOO20_23705 [Chryseobacterium sp.]
MINRRKFLQNTALAGLSITLPIYTHGFFNAKGGNVKIGVITDLHYDLVPDGRARLEAFLKVMEKEKPDAVMQMGDFAVPAAKNVEIINRFNNSHRKTLHVLGNHDTDNGHTLSQCLAMWKMDSAYYSKVIDGIRLLVLNGNEKGSPHHKGGYPSYIGIDQMEWLKQELTDAAEPVIIVSHQPLAGELEIDNAKEVRDLLAIYKKKILLAINGHTHINALLTISGIRYVHINSASYFWVGDQHKHQTYPVEFEQQYPYVRMICPYQDALFTLITIDAKRNTINIEGASSEWMGESPSQLGYKGMASLNRKDEIAPMISQRIF